MGVNPGGRRKRNKFLLSQEADAESDGHKTQEGGDH